MFTHVLGHDRKGRRIPRLIMLFGIAAVAGAATTAAVASGNPPELPMSNLNTAAGNLKTLKGGVSYQASSFPVALRVTVPDGTWGGAQWKTSSHGKPAFGWAAVGHPPLDNPRGVISLETAFGPTPSVAATVARLRAGGSHAPETNIGGTTFQEPSPVKLAGYSGRQFDGNVWGIYGHTFIPFSPKTHGASPPDSFRLEKAELFRIIVLNVRGKTVVLLLENWKLPAEQFPTFLTSANKLLKSLKFPG